MNRNETNNHPREAPKYIEPSWVDTPTSRAIWTSLMYAQATPTIVLIHGGAGLGKTHTARQYWIEKSNSPKPGAYTRNPTVYMVTCHPGMSTVTSVLCAISEALGRGGDAYRNDVMTRQILQAVMPGDLLIVDEAQHLEIKALDQIRYFSDVGQIGIAYLGNDEIYTRIYGRGRKASFIGPLKSRVGKQLQIPHPTDEDVIAILKAWHIDGKKETDYALKIGLSSIGLRGLTQVLRQSAVIAESMSRAIDSRVLLTAVTNLGYNN